MSVVFYVVVNLDLENNCNNASIGENGVASCYSWWGKSKGLDLLHDPNQDFKRKYHLKALELG